MGVLGKARELAENTPAHRNRAVDFYRVVAFAMVVIGHWLVNAFHCGDEGLTMARILIVQPWSQYLTWVFQVMPVFFFVGGYSNAASWISVREDETRRRNWAASRVRRLLLPLGPLVLFWTAFALIGRWTGMDETLLTSATRGGLIPTWFLAVYVIITLMVPVTHGLWERTGPVSVFAFGLLAVGVDYVAFTAGVEWLRWVNYAFIWLAVHQAGYWWHQGHPGRGIPVVLIAVGALALWLLVGRFGYPVSMISIPGAEVSNSSPPTAAMMAIGAVQAGIMLLAARAVARWLNETHRWAWVILASSRMMTVYLWHTTALIALLGLSLLVDGYGLTTTPGGIGWWASRPLWLVALAVMLVPFILVFGWAETTAQRRRRNPPGPLQVWSGAAIASYGIAFLALDGANAGNALGLNVVPVMAALLGVLLTSLAWPAGGRGPQ